MYRCNGEIGGTKGRMLEVELKVCRALAGKCVQLFEKFGSTQNA